MNVRQVMTDLASLAVEEPHNDLGKMIARADTPQIETMADHALDATYGNEPWAALTGDEASTACLLAAEFTA
jgi:hypothetical protein